MEYTATVAGWDLADDECLYLVVEDFAEAIEARVDGEVVGHAYNSPARWDITRHWADEERVITCTVANTLENFFALGGARSFATEESDEDESPHRRPGVHLPPSGMLTSAYLMVARRP